MTILYPTLEEILEYHENIIIVSGGFAVNDYSEAQKGRLSSIMDHIQNDNYYPTFIDKLNHLLFSIIQNHIFSDGNKRTSLVISGHFLSLNGHSTKEFQDKYMQYMENIVVDVATNSISKDELHNILSKFISQQIDK